MNSRYSQFARFAIVLFGLLATTIPMVSKTVADDGCVRFDVPSVIPSCEVFVNGAPTENDRLVEIIIPVSSMVACDDDQTVVQMMIQVRGLGAGLQVSDYAPRTQLYSDIDGPISVEQRMDRNASIGIDASGTAAEIMRLNAKANSGGSTGLSERFQRIPEQKLLLASGTINRGQGVYFKFRHSPQSTLEGGHEIVVTLRVPLSWRGGMMRVDCAAIGNEKSLFGENGFSAGNASFIVATYLKGDVEAQRTVEKYGVLETRIRSLAAVLQNQHQRKMDNDPIGQFLGYHESRFPEDWSNRFVLYDTRSIESRIRPHLPQQFQKTTDQFLASRRRVLELGR